MKSLFVKIKAWFSTKENLYETAILVLFFIFSAILRYLALAQTPYSNGWDGYFYLEQLQSLVETGRFHSPDASLIYPFLKAIFYLTGDCVLSLKIVSSLSAGFFSVSLYLLAKKLSGSREISLLAGIFTLFSPALTFFTAQFPKSLMGLAFFNLMAVSFISKKIIFTLIFLFLAFITHRFTAAFSIFFLLAYVIFSSEFLKRYKWFLLGLIALAPFSILLPGTLQIADLERLKEIFSPSPQFAPLSFFNLMGIHKFEAFWLLESCMLFLFYGATLFLVLKNPLMPKESKKNYYLFWGLLSLLIFPFLNIDLNGPGYRFFFIFLLLAPLFVLPIKGWIPKKIIWALSALFLIFSFFSFSSYKPSYFDPPYTYYQTIIKKVPPLLKNKPVDLIITHKGMAEMATFLTGKDAMAWSPESSYDREKVWRLAAEINPQDFEHYLLKEETNLIIPVTLKYTLIREDLWEKFCSRVQNSNDEELKKNLLSWKNPFRTRPDYLMNKRAR